MLISCDQGGFTARSVRAVGSRAGPISVLAFALLTGACANLQKPAAVPAPVEDRGAESPPTTAASEGLSSEQARPVPPASGAENLAAPAQHPAVAALLAEADVQLSRGQPENAAAVLERALRLAPEDAVLWHRMARLRLEQGKWQQAIVFARKSESLASANSDLQVANARLIARAMDMSHRKN